MATAEQQRVAGKWRACQPPSNFHKGKVFIRPENSELLIATVSAELRLTESIYASRLIAAAPDLLDACNGLLGLCELLAARDDLPTEVYDAIANNHRVEAMRIAIAKAEGRP